jgi:hypothetical protein
MYIPPARPCFNSLSAAVTRAITSRAAGIKQRPARCAQAVSGGHEG